MWIFTLHLKKNKATIAAHNIPYFPTSYGGQNFFNQAFEYLLLLDWKVAEKKSWLWHNNLYFEG